ncbi:uncharacterized protein PGTG_14067 [Puccinia graminis f. sp. tritici CRL 75-36-700-3]|uniref:DDE Tnp4 domain-containing protein n=1 Tax=Puccinia graminis f. sp. tritici (strain CRL 75-36-700-3 / race SCCL) TaxID=418459 RepID=E3KW14_PUCGT|nr:uncharacterized protein PGTG_14067 [Puccinia graminis f. sp. tritici CRL 75-36-700-3]EFP88489.1 hypothetical protein PGTG_14067 [Puccinia graminis f. sp. tritici CRL 75-36-700-3]
MTVMAIQGILGLDEDISSGSEDGSSDEDEYDMDWEEIDNLLIWLHVICSKRYFRPCQTLEQPPAIHDYLMNKLEASQFKQEFRMTQLAFTKLCARIRNNTVSQSNSHNPQHPIKEQLMVALERLGCFGNGASVGMLARFFGVGEGTFELCTNRFIMAILRIKTQIIQWPSPEDRKEIKANYAEVGFDGCVGLIDGVLIPLTECPSKNGSDFYSRKGSYGITTLIACDSNRNINFLYTGWPGCSHDQRVMGNSRLALEPNQFFSPGEYLLAD